MRTSRPATASDDFKASPARLAGILEGMNMNTEPNDTARADPANDVAHPSNMERVENAIAAGLGKAKAELTTLEREAIDEFKRLSSSLHDWLRKHTGAGPTPSVHLQTAAAQLDAAAETVGVHFATKGEAAKASS
jgi:hypothetical protein